MILLSIRCTYHTWFMSAIKMTSIVEVTLLSLSCNYNKKEIELLLSHWQIKRILRKNIHLNFPLFFPFILEGD